MFCNSWVFFGSQWVVPENIRTPTVGGILEFRMHGGVLWPGIPNARGGLLGLEFRMHEEVSSPRIPKGGGGWGAKNSDLLTSEVRKTSLVCARAKQTEPQRYNYEVGMRSLFRIAMKRRCLRQLFQWSFR